MDKLIDAMLRPCPFCGGEAMGFVIQPHTHELANFMSDYQGGAFIECPGCEVVMSGESESAVVNAWNRRAGGDNR